MSDIRFMNHRERFHEWCQWYDEHQKDAHDVYKRLDFQQKMIEGLMELMAMTIRDIQNLRGVPKDKRLIILPKVNGYSRTV